MSSNLSKQEKAAQWFQHIEQWRASGLTRSQYCQQHGLSFHALGYWIGRHRMQARNDGGLTFIAAQGVNSDLTTLSAELILHCPNGSKLVLPRDTPAQWLGSLLGQLR